MSITLLVANILVAQDSIAVLSSGLLEDLLENNDEQTYDFYALYDELQIYLKNPININQATEEDLQNLQMLSDIQINDILQYRNELGPFISKYELQTIPSLDMATLRAIMPLITEGGEQSNHTISSLFSESNSTLFLKWKRVIQKRKGFIDEKYLGDENHLFARYNFASGRNIRAVVTMEKDPGEQFFRGNNKTGFDYYSGFLHIRDLIPKVSTLNIGDYSVSMGQGLILHNSFGSGKSSYVTNIKQGGRTIRPYSSVNEANFFRGIAATIDINKDIDLTVFGSTKNIDGTVRIDSTIDTGFETISSIRVDGFHRTEREIENENTVKQQTYGGIMKYKKRNYSIGFNLLSQHFSAPLTIDDQLYKKYRFSGDHLTNMSIDYSYRYKNFNTFGEIAQSNNGGRAFVGGLLTSLGRNVDLGFIFRDYQKNYQVLNANAFSESTLPINERGTYLSLKVRATNKITLSTYFDLWHHSWLRFQKDAPSNGREFLLKGEYKLKRKLNLYIQYRYEEKQKNDNSTSSKIDPLTTIGQHRIRLHIGHTLNKSLKLRNRFEYTSYLQNGITSKGYMIYQDIIYKPLGKSYSFTARYALFDTDNFNTRIYTYENDILYEFSIPFYTDKGSRFYINWRQKIGRKLVLEGRYARTYYDNRTTIGSSGNLIEGNVRSEVKMQLKYKF
ncbi:MAG: helix-hairpin-helix domain-containing protein [Saprospiraceae bacterium]